MSASLTRGSCAGMPGMIVYKSKFHNCQANIMSTTATPMAVPLGMGGTCPKELRGGEITG